MNSAYRTWKMPFVLGMVSFLGLGAALLADGWGDALSWLLLAVPLLVILRHAVAPARGK